MRLQVFLSKAGIASRRSSTVINRIYPKHKLYIMFNKPEGVVTTKRDPFEKKTVIDLLPETFKHLNPVGRLDKDTTGLLLFTNDGELINKLTHPRFNVEKTYIARLDRALLERDRLEMEKGVELDGKITVPCKIILRNRNEVEIVLHEGRKRQIKRMFLKKNYSAVSLQRVKEAGLSLGSLARGKWRFLTECEIANLKNKIEA